MNDEISNTHPVKPETRHSKLIFPLTIINFRPPRIAMVLTVIALAVHLIPKIWDGIRFSVPQFGVPLGLIGFFIMIWAWWLFKKGNVAVCPKSKTASLITQGPYRFTRNPMYLGMVFILLGIAFCVGTPPFFLSTITFLLIINFVFCPYEENKLSSTFGKEFTNYKKRVRRWI